MNIEFSPSIVCKIAKLIDSPVHYHATWCYRIQQQKKYKNKNKKEHWYCDCGTDKKYWDALNKARIICKSRKIVHRIKSIKKKEHPKCD